MRTAGRLILESGDWGDPINADDPYIEGPKGKIFKGFKLDPSRAGDDGLSLCPDPEPMISDFSVFRAGRGQKFGLKRGQREREHPCWSTSGQRGPSARGRKACASTGAQRFKPVGTDEAKPLAGSADEGRGRGNLLRI